MEPSKILSANILDLIFDDRNKEYGAYELRKTYSGRIAKALLITALTALLAFTGAVLANSIKPDDRARLAIKEVTLEEIKQKQEPEPLPDPKKPQPEPQVQTQKLTAFNVVPDEIADDPPPTTDDLLDSKIDLIKKDGVVDEGIAESNDLDEGKGIIEPKKDDTPEGPAGFVEIQAKFVGNWEKFLTRNLNGNVPVDNGAPAGRYTVLVQFVVDLEGNVSDIKPLTGHGYGMEEEAVRVLKKATKWEPGIQNGYPVKAYRRQPITFIIEEQ